MIAIDSLGIFQNFPFVFPLFFFLNVLDPLALSTTILT